MAVRLDHHIVHARDAAVSSAFWSEVLGLTKPVRWGPFTIVRTDNGVSIDFIETDDEKYLVPNHYAFLVGEDDFDVIFARIQARGLPYFADPAGKQQGQINHHDGGRGVYWAAPDGHWLEIITRPYGSGG